MLYFQATATRGQTWHTKQSIGMQRWNQSREPKGSNRYDSHFSTATFNSIYFNFK